MQIIQENRKPSFSETLANGLGSLAQSAPGFLQALNEPKRMKEENESLKNMGIDIEGVHNPELRKAIVTQAVKQKEDKAIEKQQTLTSMEGTIAELKSMAEGDVPGIGRLGQWSQSSEALYNRGRMQTLGSDLLSFYKTLFPRGITQQEFIRLEKDYIPKPGDPTSKMLGKLDGFQDLISRKLRELGVESASGRPKFDISNPGHKSKRDQLMKKFKGDREKVKSILSREFEE